MNRLAASSALGLALGIACTTLALIPAAQDDGAAGAQAPGAPPAATPALPTVPPVDTKFTDADRSPEAIARGQARLAEAAKAYRAAPTLTDAVDVDVTTPMGPQSESMKLIFGKGNDMRVDVQGMRITSLNNEVFVEVDEVATDKFVGVPLKDGNVPATLATVADGFALPLPHMTFRFDADGSDTLEGLTVGTLQNLAVGGFRVDPVTGEELLLVASNGKGVATIDAATSLLKSYAVNFQPPGAPEGMEFAINFGFTPVVADELATPITFSAGERTRVASLEALMMRLQIGDVAPDFTLKTSTGESVALADLKGKIVVLDFWATWCGPCRKGLPEVNKFAEWVQSSGLPVKVFGVNVWEDQEKNAEKRTTQATQFWTNEKFSFPTLLDLDDTVADAYGPNGIPTTFVIDAQGRIARIHTGFNSDMLEMLKKDVEEIVVIDG